MPVASDTNIHRRMMRLVVFIVAMSVIASVGFTHLSFVMMGDSPYWPTIIGAFVIAFVISLIASLYVVRLHLALHRTHGELVRTARLDPLTGLLNRRAFSEEAQMIMGQGLPVFAILCDLDHFKSVNDRLGHGAGDLALRHCAHIIGNHSFQNGIAGRHGGEEFVLIVESDGNESLMRAVESLRSQIANASLLSAGHRFSLTASFGIARWNGSESLDALIHRADAALYRAKDEGRNRLALAA